jgi:hypothetical protein
MLKKIAKTKQATSPRSLCSKDATKKKGKKAREKSNQFVAAAI